MKLIYAILCRLGLHKIGEVRAWNGSHPNSQCEHCGKRLWFDEYGDWNEIDDE